MIKTASTSVQLLTGGNKKHYLWCHVRYKKGSMHGVQCARCPPHIGTLNVRKYQKSLSTHIAISMYHVVMKRAAWGATKSEIPNSPRLTKSRRGPNVSRAQMRWLDLPWLILPSVCHGMDAFRDRPHSRTCWPHARLPAEWCIGMRERTPQPSVTVIFLSKLNCIRSGVIYRFDRSAGAVGAEGGEEARGQDVRTCGSA